MTSFLIAFLLGVVSCKPQYNYQRPSGGAISPGATPLNEKPALLYPSQAGDRGNYSVNRPNNEYPVQTGTNQNNYNEQQAVIQKNVYVHFPPPELEEDLQQAFPVQNESPKKSYNIIFIKTPDISFSRGAAFPVQPLKEEKTLVYVLVKRPEAPAQAVTNFTSEQTPPSKPEVFFVRYRTNKDTGSYPKVEVKQNEPTSDKSQDDQSSNRYLPPDQTQPGTG